MASEVISIPEEDLKDFCGVIRRGVDGTEPCHVAEYLMEWVSLTEAYIMDLEELQEDRQT